MFEQVIEGPYGANRAWTTMAGFAGQALMLSAAVLAPLVAPDALPRPQSLVTLLYPAAPVAPPPAAAPEAPAAPRPTRQAIEIQAGRLLAPAAIPDRPVLIEEPPLTAAEMGGAPGGVPGGIEGGLPGGVLHGLPAIVARQVAPPAPAPAPPPAAVRPAAPARIKVGGNVQQARILHQAIPVYPALARQARVSGIVELVGIVGTDGRIRQLQLVSGHPLLVAAALEAVRQWVYRPTYLNGDPVEVIAPITVHFRMN
jgi:periplasmic protein TonB